MNLFYRVKQTSLALLVLLFLIFLSVSSVQAHPGGTDSNGGHTDSESGEYHYHHGYPAHSHSDMDGDGVKDCPYEFDDKAGQSSSNSSSPGKDKGSSSATSSKNSEQLSGTTSSKSSNNNSKKSFDIYSAEYFIFGSCATLVLILLSFLVVQLDEHNKKTAAKIVIIPCVILGIADIPFLFIAAQALLVIGLVLLLLWGILRFLYRVIKKLVTN